MNSANLNGTNLCTAELLEADLCPDSDQRAGLEAVAIANSGLAGWDSTNGQAITSFYLAKPKEI